MIHHGVAVSISVFEPLPRGDRTFAELADQRSFVPSGTFRSTGHEVPVINHGAIFGRPRGSG
jgi:hypothetical protein